MNLEQMILQEHSKEISASMDRLILENARFVARQAEGWYLVKISKAMDNEHAIDINRWLFENIAKDTYQRDIRDFIFLRAEDATLFALRWA